MKRIAYMSAILALLVFSGCSSKEPTIDTTANGSTSGSNMGQASSATKVDNSAVIDSVTNANAVDTSAQASNGAAAEGITSILFDYDKFDIREDMQEKLKVNGALLKNKTFKLEGNCDEFGSDEYNFALGLKRANSVKSALVDAGISADSISMTSLGEGNPVCLEKTQECWAKNRRVDFKLP
ncbi:MAG TPA: OmpA family protein [Sulfuricurvum sp.]|nr:OmpA family protein [Sulfuricurvum sp.]